MPTVSVTSIASNNITNGAQSPTLAKAADVITLTFVTNEKIHEPVVVFETNSQPVVNRLGNGSQVIYATLAVIRKIGLRRIPPTRVTTTAMSATLSTLKILPQTMALKKPPVGLLGLMIYHPTLPALPFHLVTQLIKAFGLQRQTNGPSPATLCLLTSQVTLL